MEEWVVGTTIGDLKGLSKGSIPPFPTKNQGVFWSEVPRHKPLSYFDLPWGVGLMFQSSEHRVMAKAPSPPPEPFIITVLSPKTLNPKTLNPKPKTLNPKTLNPKTMKPYIP